MIYIRKICIITERRADYSRIKPIIQEIEKDPDLDYFLLVTGQHLLPELGNTINVIESDGFKIFEKIDMFSKNEQDSGADMSRALGKVLIGITDALEKLKPDILVVGFDLGAHLAGAIAGAHMNIPIAHIQGGEVTGSIDESLRHAITKFSHIHFAANQDAVERLIKMGEDPKLVFNVGCPSLDVALNSKLLTKELLIEEFDIDASKPLAILIQHPVTTEADVSTEQIMITIDAINELNLQTILIYPNVDAGGRRIISEIQKTDIKRYDNLPFETFLSLLSMADVLIGNSSSGIREAASFHLPVVNIGTRQEGRLRPDNVIDVDYNRTYIIDAIKKALYDVKFKEMIQKCNNPYGDGNSSKRIVKILKELELKPEMLQKKICY